MFQNKEGGSKLLQKSLQSVADNSSSHLLNACYVLGTALRFSQFNLVSPTLAHASRARRRAIWSVWVEPGNLHSGKPPDQAVVAGLRITP